MSPAVEKLGLQAVIMEIVDEFVLVDEAARVKAGMKKGVEICEETSLCPPLFRGGSETGG